MITALTVLGGIVAGLLVLLLVVAVALVVLDRFITRNDPRPSLADLTDTQRGRPLDARERELFHALVDPLRAEGLGTTGDHQ